MFPRSAWPQTLAARHSQSRSRNCEIHPTSRDDSYPRRRCQAARQARASDRAARASPWRCEPEDRHTQQCRKPAAATLVPTSAAAAFVYARRERPAMPAQAAPSPDAWRARAPSKAPRARTRALRRARTSARKNTASALQAPLPARALPLGCRASKRSRRKQRPSSRRGRSTCRISIDVYKRQ